MISAAAIRRWCWVHKWTSLVCTLFLLMLCLTGLPLIFHHEIDDAATRPLTSRLLKPILIDAQTGALTDKRDMPWYITALLVSQPLHFGDYGGLPLKVIWALFAMLAIVLLASGVYLWWKRRKVPVEIDLRPSEPTAELAAAEARSVA